MIVCICHNVSERKIQQAVDGGVTTMPQLRERLQVGTCCGKCHPHAKQVLRECVAKHQAEEARENVFPMIFQFNRMAA